jgi:O-acetyl-ADP-ribose deacetylase (regulator of RNase III)
VLRYDPAGEAWHGRSATGIVMTRISILQGDITTLPLDAIVNAANERLLGGGGVDGAIHRAAGPKLLDACRAIPEVRPGVRCPTGESRITAGFELPARYVIHTVGPVWQGGTRGEPDLLARCYRSTLTLAARHDVRSIAFPAISCGIYGYPLDAAAAIAVREIRALDAQHTVAEVTLVAFDGSVLAALRRAVGASP